MVDKDVTRTVPRAVVFRLGASGRTLGYAAAGYLEGTVDARRPGAGPAGKLAAWPRAGSTATATARSPTRRIGSGSTCNGDGRFDPAAEQFLFATVLNLDGARYVVRSDELGSRLSLEPLIGVGTLRLAWKGAGRGTGRGLVRRSSVELHATALGRDGSVYGLSGTEPASVPVGEYRLGTVTIALDDPRGGQRWSFIFSDNGAKGEPRWYKVEKDAAVAIDPIGTPLFEIDLRDDVGEAQAARRGRQPAALALHRRRAVDQRRLSRRARLAGAAGDPRRPGLAPRRPAASRCSPRRTPGFA